MLIKWVDRKSELPELLPKRLHQHKEAARTPLQNSDFSLSLFCSSIFPFIYLQSLWHSYQLCPITREHTFAGRS